MAAFAAFGEHKAMGNVAPPTRKIGYSGGAAGSVNTSAIYSDSGTAARFFYCAKADKTDRAGSKHPTVKPIALLRWLVRLVTPPGGTVLDPFAGSGTTGAAALAEGRRAILIEREPEYIADIRRRLNGPTATAERDCPLSTGSATRSSMPAIAEIACRKSSRSTRS
jgi:site-specific DNA-methyltransferase (adenine-specific)